MEHGFGFEVAHSLAGQYIQYVQLYAPTYHHILLPAFVQPCNAIDRDQGHSRMYGVLGWVGGWYLGIIVMRMI